MSKKIFTLLALLLIATMALTACGGNNDANDNVAENVVEDVVVEVVDPVKICQVTDTGGIDDTSFNQTAWKGVLDAEVAFGVEGAYLESQQQTDYETNLNAFVEEGCDLIIAVGFLMGDATAAAAEANPTQNYAIIDYAYDPGYDNVLGLVYATDQPSFLAGYIAAATTETGVVATFGGMQFPSVTAFMDGFVYGVEYYNAENGTEVVVLGWDPASQTGLFVGNFESTDDGRAMGETLMDEGADVILPVAGPVGLGTAAAIQGRGTGWIIGVDSDWTVTNAQYADIVLTSILKHMDISVFDASEAVLNGTFAGGIAVGTLENGGVGVVGDFDIQSLIDGIIAGDIITAP